VSSKATSRWAHASGSRRDRQLQRDEIEARERFGDRMLDWMRQLHSRKWCSPCRRRARTRRCRVAVADRLGERDRASSSARAAAARAPAPAPPRRASGSGAASSSRARPGGSRRVLIGRDLDLDVARRCDQALDVEALVAERGARLGPGQAVAQAQLREVAASLMPRPRRRRRPSAAPVACSRAKARPRQRPYLAAGETGRPACCASARAASLSPAVAITAPAARRTQPRLRRRSAARALARKP